jgi:hypothetical protein
MTRVRPRFIIALLAVLPFLAHSIWDYVEARRLRTRIDAIRSRGEPVGPRDVPRAAAATDADRFYRAAAILASGFDLSAEPGRRYQLSTAIRNGNWTPDVREEVRARLAPYSEAMELADRAAELPFDAFASGTTYNYLTSHVWSLARVCALRATVRALDGDSDGAYAALYSAVRVQRALDRPYHFPGLKIVVERSQPSPAARARVRRALGELNVDDLLKQSFIRMRSVWLNGYDQSVTRNLNAASWLVRPWATHRMTETLDRFAMLVDAAGKPESQRAEAIQQVGEFPGGFPLSREERRASFERFIRSVVADADWVRCARRAVAGEPIDCKL